MSDQPLEFIDYIFDRYAYLGLEDSATRADIQAEIKKRKVENHPDRLVNAGEDLKLKAEANWKLIGQCEDVLLNDDMRVLYDKRLNEFKEKKPRLISKNGTPIVSLERDSIDISFLTSGKELDLSKLKEQAAVITSHNIKDFDRAERLYGKTPDDADFLDMYRGALQKKLTYLEIFEKYLWMAAGVSGSFTESGETIMDPTMIRATVAVHIEHIRDNVIPSFIEKRNNLLALGHEKNPLLLLTHNEEAPANTQALSTEVLATIQTAQSRFELLSEAIKDNAEERGKTTEKLLDLSPFEIIHSVDAERVTVYLIMDEPDSNSINAGRVVGATKYRDGTMAVQAMEQGMNADDIRNLPADETIAIVLFNRELGEPLLDFGYAYKRILRLFGKDVELTVKDADNNSKRPEMAHASPTPLTTPEA